VTKTSRDSTVGKLSPAQVALAERVFLEVTELPAERRSSYLDAACSGDGDVRREVESLLAFHSPATVFPDGSIVARGSVSMQHAGDGASARSVPSRVPVWAAMVVVAVVAAVLWEARHLEALLERAGVVGDLAHELERENAIEGLLVVLGVALGAWLVVRTARAQAASAAPHVAGDYTLLQRIGSGGMGDVYMARHALLARPTAVKVMRTNLDEKAGLRFQREVQLASQLRHPNTIQIFDFGKTDDGRYYFSMEYLPGITLQELVKQSGPLPPARALFVLQQICASLREAHQRGFIHRDIKPLNVMLCELGGEYDVVKVLDFGLVKDVTDPNPTLDSGDRSVFGTPSYMAPERLVGGAKVDRRCDIYSVGAVAYYLLVGAHVHSAGPAAELLARIVRDDVPPLPESNAAVPAPLDELVRQCLSKAPEKRPESVDVIIDRLGQMLREGALAEWTRDDARRWWDSYRATHTVTD